MLPRRSSRRSTSSQFTEMSDNIENTAPEKCDTPIKPKIAPKPNIKPRTPLTPMQSTLYGLREKLEKQLAGQIESLPIEDKTSPGLARLRMTPGKTLKEKQHTLMKKHQDARNKIDKLTLGGGISLWPEMENMRMTSVETIQLCGTAFGLVFLTTLLFKLLHGSLQSKLNEFHSRLREFQSFHPIDVSTNQTVFTASVLEWHTDYTSLVEDIERTFAVTFRHTSVTYQVFVVLYIVGITVLLYYLADNMLAKSKLTPRRIKTWVLLLVIIGTWTCLGLSLLFSAQNVEKAVESNVHYLTRQLGTLIHSSHDLTVYDHVLTYWRIRCLPPTTHGVLTIMGLFPVRDVSYYLQYYSLPVLTALLTPVVRLVIAVKQVYTTTAQVNFKTN